MTKPIFSYFEESSQDDIDLLLQLLPYLEDEARWTERKNPRLAGTYVPVKYRYTFNAPPSIKHYNTIEIDIPKDSGLDPIKYLVECLHALPNSKEHEMQGRSIDRLDGISLSVIHALPGRNLQTVYLRPASRHEPLAVFISDADTQTKWIANDDHPWVEFHYQPIRVRLARNSRLGRLRITLNSLEANHILSRDKNPVESMRKLSLLPKAPPIVINDEDWDYIF